jgi:hypothetical protein
MDSLLPEVVLTGNQSVVYGRCIVADYNSVYKDKCAVEFMKLKDCYLVIVPPAWLP